MVSYIKMPHKSEYSKILLNFTQLCTRSWILYQELGGGSDPNCDNFKGRGLVDYQDGDDL